MLESSVARMEEMADDRQRSESIDIDPQSSLAPISERKAFDALEWGLAVKCGLSEETGGQPEGAESLLANISEE